jgi:hypothetical protein
MIKMKERKRSSNTKSEKEFVVFVAHYIEEKERKKISDKDSRQD